MKNKKEMTILGIETSCDDTCIALIKAESGGFEILSNIVSSQVEIHKKYGGVYPFMAKREHQKNLEPTLQLALKKAKISEKNIDLIAITSGPGLEPCLWVGINFAKELAKKWNMPIVPVNHIESHILVNFIDLKSKIKNQKSKTQIKNKKIFPAICLVVSGGHTQLILIDKIGKYKILGETRDDAAGECFDKCAKILGLPYPGGPAIAKIADMRCPSVDGAPPSVKLPRPMLNTKDYDFSFSGLKTAVLYANQKAKTKNQKYKQKMAEEIQQAIIDVLIKKTIKAARDYRAKSIILGGGVSANKKLRKQFLYNIQYANYNIQFFAPAKNLSTDNAVMTAIAGYFHRNQKIATPGIATLEAKANLRI